jgi:hypothetical protein
VKRASNANLQHGMAGGPVSRPAADGQETVPPKNGVSALSLWLWVGAGFLFMALLWTGMIIAVRQADSRTVPLATPEAAP